MHEKIKNSCPNCCQLYSLKSLSSEPISNIPLFIKCGHTICECCVRNIVNFGEPIECKICLRTMDIKTGDMAKLLQNKNQLYKTFPVNVSALGELALELIADESETEEKKAEDYFIDLQAILDSTDQNQDQCLECHGATTKMCQQCATVICEDCFTKSHKNFIVFKNHVLQNIELQMTPNNCNIHSQKSLEYYCKDCAKTICMDCLMVGSEKSCKNHDVVPILEKTEKFLSDLREISPQVDTTFWRLTKTAVDIGHLLLNMDNESGSPELRQVTASIDQHFSKLQATVQAHRQEVMENVARLRRIERDSLLRAREEVAAAIKQSKQVMDALKSALDSQHNQTTNLSALLEDAKNIVDRPWCLSKDESDKDSLKVCVSEELCLLVSDYVQLVGNAQARYALRGSRQLSAVPPPPRAPVFPPALPRDVRLNKPEVDGSTPTDRPKGVDGVRAKGNSCRSSADIKKAAIQTVLHFADKKTLIELKAGAQELVHITHMVDPHHFYVRRLCDDALFTELEDQLGESFGEVPRDVTVGKMYAVKYDNSWKRCRVDGIDEGSKLPTYRVTCVDFGYTTSVNADDLRDMPPALTLSAEARYPALALRCRLANCAPEAGWRAEHTALLLRMVDRAPVVVHVRRAGECSACDVTTRAGFSVARALRFHARAALPDVQQPWPEAAGDQPRLQPADSRLRSESDADVLITHVVSPDKFYVRESRLEKEYMKLCQELNKTYDVRDESDLIYLPKEGLVCVALVEPGAGWARAQVLSVNSPEDVRVWEPDSGRRLAVPWHRLRAIRPRFTALRAMAIESHLAGLTPTGGRWRPEAGELLEQHTGRNLRLIVARQSHRRSLGAVLVDPASSICLNQELIAKQLAIVDRSTEFQHLTAKYFPPEIQPTSQTPDISSVSSDTSNGAMMPMMAKTYQEEFQAESKELIRLEAKILHYESPSLIYISLVHQQKTFTELFDDMQKFYSKRKTTRREKWNVDDRCCALCIQSETWRRATVIKTERDKVTVFYTDFAQTETVPISNLKKLHSDFEVIGDAAVKCHLAGVLPADPAGEWQSLTKEFLKDKLDEYKRVFVTKVGEFLAKSMPVQLWVYHTELGSALEPDESSWRCLNAELVARGLALPAGPQIETTKVSSGPDDELRFLNVRGSVSAWLLPRPPGGSGSSGSAPARWLPPDPLRATEFTAMPTYIDNDGIIYLHDVAQNDDLDFIRDTLQMAFKEDDPIAAYCTWRIGEPCVARYYLDKSFYRGTVVEVNQEQASCLVQYVDYGNSERCLFADLRKRIALHQIPIQAHKCSLHRIKPIGDQWDLTVLDYIHKAIVEKKCFVKVAGPAVDGVTPVDLKYDKLWINDHLVEFELAAYVDGAKPMESQFKKKMKRASSTPEKTKPVEIQDVIDVTNNSEPDYIVEEDMLSSQASASPDSFKMSTLVDRSSSASEIVNTSLVMYLRHDEREFSCNIPVINDTNTLELSIIRDAEINPTYEALFEVIKEQGKNMPPLDGTYEYKPCIALFEDNWYRASILKYSEAKNLLKVHYVDYGNIGIVPLSGAREISKDWVCLPPACVTARLHGLVVNPQLSSDSVTKAFIDTFLDKGPFRATIVDYADYDNSVPLVELRNGDGELVYHKLIEDNVLLRDAGDNCTVLPTQGDMRSN